MTISRQEKKIDIVECQNFSMPRRSSNSSGMMVVIIIIIIAVVVR
jgi:hypothetical protein